MVGRTCANRSMSLVNTFGLFFTCQDARIGRKSKSMDMMPVVSALTSHNENILIRGSDTPDWWQATSRLVLALQLSRSACYSKL